MYNIAIIGASGYTGSELIRLIYNHNTFKIKFLSAERNAGISVSDIYPHFNNVNLPEFVKFDDIDFEKTDLAFSCLPHSHSQELIQKIPKKVKVIDLSADFRLTDFNEYKFWYGKEHVAKALQKKAVYGLTEIYRKKIKNARLVAGTGCNSATGLYPLIPLIKGGIISLENIIIYLATGVSGAGRSPKKEIIHTEVSEGFSAYNVNSHRHLAEFDQELSKVAKRKVKVSFIPHILPQNRGILASISVEGSAEEIHKTLSKFYINEKFIQILPFGHLPSTRSVRGSNLCIIGVSKGRLKNNAVVFSTLDNLIKGASGQAIQNANVMLNVDESDGLNSLPIFP